MAGASEGIRAKGWRDCACGGRWLLRALRPACADEDLPESQKDTGRTQLHSAWLPQRCAESKTYQLAAPPVAVRSAVGWSRGLLERACRRWLMARRSDGVRLRPAAALFRPPRPGQGRAAEARRDRCAWMGTSMPGCQDASLLTAQRDCSPARSPHSRCARWSANLLVSPTEARKFAAESAAGPAVNVGKAPRLATALRCTLW